MAAMLALTSLTTVRAEDAAVSEPAAAGAPRASAFGSYLAGRFAQASGDLASASDYIDVTLGDDPENAELLQRAFLVRLGEGRIDATLEIAKRLEKVEGGPATVGTFLAVQAVKTGDFAAAERYATGVAPGGANRFVAPLLKAWSRVAAGDLDGALTMLAPLERIEGFGAVYYMQRGLMYDQGGRLTEAEQDYVKALEISGDVPLRLIQVLGNLYARTGRAKEAQATYDRFLEINPDSQLLEPDLQALRAGTKPAPIVGSAAQGLAEAMFGLSTILLREDASDIALLFARLALDLRPDHQLSQVLLGDILRKQERLAEAVDAYRAVADGTPYAWAARLSIAESLDEMGQEDAAQSMLKTMIDEQPARYDAASILGNLLRAKERFAEAAAAYDIAVSRIKTFKEDDWLLLYFRGISYERSDQWEKAEADFQKALELSPDQPFVLNYLAYSWVDKGKNYDRALDMLDKAVEQRPNDGYIVDSLGWVFYRLGRYEDAVEQLERAVGLKPLDPVLNDHLGDAYWRVGRKLEARFQWQRALQFKPEPDQIGQIQAKIEKGLATSGAPDSGG
jgi:tetratricopeptide (TPR) repeat protein